MIKTQLEQAFLAFYHQSSIICAHAPGRINLIGEHVDYNGGLVFPAAIDLGIDGAVSWRGDRELHFFSENFIDEGEVIVSLDDLMTKHSSWTLYPCAVLKALEQIHIVLPQGVNFYFCGNLPNNAGLSSSAAIEVLCFHLVLALCHKDINPMFLVQMAQYAENHFVKVQCGIMDQFAVNMGKKQHFLLLDTVSLHYETIPSQLEGYDFIIINTNKVRGLLSSEYNHRRSECEFALKKLQTKEMQSNLSEYSLSKLEDEREMLTDSEYRRVRHVLSEKARVIAMKNALISGDAKQVGELLTASHTSLQKDYEVSCEELDALVDSCIHHSALGARMTGAGFGGCIIALVSSQCKNEMIEAVKKEYEARFGYDASVYPVKIEDGCHLL